MSKVWHYRGRSIKANFCCLLLFSVQKDGKLRSYTLIFCGVLWYWLFLSGLFEHYNIFDLCLGQENLNKRIKGQRLTFLETLVRINHQVGIYLDNHLAPMTKRKEIVLEGHIRIHLRNCQIIHSKLKVKKKIRKRKRILSAN